MMEFLLNYGTLTVVGIVWLVSLLLLVLARRRLSKGWKGILLVLFCVSTLYLAFVVYAVIGFGSNAHPPAVQAAVKNL